jgi:uncharacterized protein YgiM (DUF1202 family)
MKKYLYSFLFALVLMVSFFGAEPAQAAETSEKAGIIRTSSTNLNVRSSPSLSGSILTGLPKGSYVTLVSKSGSWWKVEYAQGRYGYCSADYIETVPVQTATVYVSGSRLNIRSGPSTSYAILSQYADRASVTVLSSAKGWAKVLFGGTRIGYVSETYLSYSSTSAPSGNSAVVLSVPRYAENDARWASVRLGSSRYTIGQIGCTTSAMAMVETAVEVVEEEMHTMVFHPRTIRPYYPLIRPQLPL